MDLLADRLRELRKKKGLTLRDLGSMVGLSYQAIQAYESGRSKPSIKTLEKLAKCWRLT